MEGIFHEQKNVDCIKEFFLYEYHNLKLAQKLSSGQTVYYREKNVVSTREIAFILNNLILAETFDQSQVDQLMEKIYHRIETSKILGDQIKQLPETNVVL